MRSHFLFIFVQVQVLYEWIKNANVRAEIHVINM